MVKASVVYKIFLSFFFQAIYRIRKIDHELLWSGARSWGGALLEQVLCFGFFSSLDELHLDGYAAFLHT